jgi:hypothetical protein
LQESEVGIQEAEIRPRRRDRFFAIRDHKEQKNPGA